MGVRHCRGMGGVGTETDLSCALPSTDLCDGIVQVKIPRAVVTEIKQHPLDAKEKRKQMKKVERDYDRGTGGEGTA